MILHDLRNELQDFNTNDFFWGFSSQEFLNKNSKNTADFSSLKNGNQKSYINNIDLNLENYKTAILSIKESGITNFRFSLSWEEIIPDGIGFVNNSKILFYHCVLDYCIANEIEPFVTLFDLKLPDELEKKGGFLNRDILIWFENYVSICLNAFKNKVNYWIVSNQPSVFTGVDFFLDKKTVTKNSLNNFLPVLHHTLLCISLGFKTIKQISPQTKVGAFFSCHYITSKSFSEKDLKAAERIDTILNRVFLEPSLGLGYPISTVPCLKKISKYIVSGDSDLLKVDFDFIGLHNCSSEVVTHDLFIPFVNARILKKELVTIKNDTLHFELYADLIHRIIKKYSKYEGLKKIFIIENDISLFEGVDLIDNQNTTKKVQIKFFLQQILNSKNSGGKVAGYFISNSKNIATNYF